MQVLSNGVISGLTIALLAVGFSAVYVPTRVFYIGLAAVYTAAPYVFLECLNRGIPMPVSVLLALLSGVALSVLCEVVNHGPLERRTASAATQMVASIGAYIVIVQAVVLMWGNETKVISAGDGNVLSIGSVALSPAQTMAAVLAPLLLLVFGAYLRWTRAGLCFRALAENPTEFALRGYSVMMVRAQAFALAGLFASVAALLVAHDIGFEPQRGLPALLPAVVATIIGGRMSFLGAAIGGILLGVVRSGVVYILAARWQEPVTFIVLIAVLLIRPGGIFTRVDRLEAEG